MIAFRAVWFAIQGLIHVPYWARVSSEGTCKQAGHDALERPGSLHGLRRIGFQSAVCINFRQIKPSEGYGSDPYINVYIYKPSIN